MIDNVVAALGLGLNLTDEEIADVLWLAVQMQQFGDGVISEQGDRNEALENSVSNRESPKLPAQPPRNDDRDRQDENKKDEQNFEVHSKNAQGDDRSTRRSDELQLKIPDARSLQEPLELARSLRPLMRRVPSQVNTLLDEEATVRKIAEEKIWCPVLRPALEPWLDLALVIDDSASMLMWRHTIAELQHFLSSYGVFRDVRVWRLGTDKAEKVCIYAGATASDRNGSPRSPSELIEANGRGLVLVVSDCIAPIWRNGAIASALKVWSRSGMAAILQMLPDWLWARTALGRGVAAQFSALAAGIPNYQLTTTTVSTWYDIDLATSIKIPVVTLEPEKFTAWAEMLAGKGGAWSAGIVFEPELFAVPEVAIEFDGASVLDAEDRVQSFRLTASPIARRLAGLLAAAPVISLPIVRILQSKVLTQSQPVHVAEVFLGGLLKPLSEITAKTNPNYVQYDFIEGVRDLLLESVPSSEVINIVAVVSEYIAERLGFSLEEFAAVIRNPQQIEDSKIAGNIGYFATITAKILRSLGGEYVKIAEEFESYYQRNIKTPVKQNYNHLWEQENTKIYSFCTDQPWVLPFDALVLSVGIEVGFGRLALSFSDSLEEKSVYLHNAINKVKGDLNKSTISPSEPLFIALPSEINNQLFPSDVDKLERFIICATVESPEIIVENAREATESVINMSTNRGLKCVVIPLLGTGSNHLAIDKVALEMLLAIQKTVQSLSSNPIEQIIIVDKKETTITTINQIAKSLVKCTQLQKLLIAQNWKKADKETARIMLQISGQEEREWLDEEDMKTLPSIDLQTIDELWLKYSNGKFGFSVQKHLWLSAGGCIGEYDHETYKRFGEIVGWYIKDRDKWLLWDDHTFDLDAPQGHLPRYLPSQQKRIRHYLFYRKDLVSQPQNTILQEDQISESIVINERPKAYSTTTYDEQGIDRSNRRNNIKEKRDNENNILLVGSRGAGKTTYMAALAALTSLQTKNSAVAVTIYPQNQSSEELLRFGENTFLGRNSFSPTSLIEELPPHFWLRIDIKRNLFLRPLSDLRGVNTAIDTSLEEFSDNGEILENDRRNNDYLLDRCASNSKLLFLINGTSRNDMNLEATIRQLPDKLAEYLNYAGLARYKIAVVMSKIEEPSLWVNRHRPKDLVNTIFPKTGYAFERWSRDWNCKIEYFACSTFGVMGNLATPNLRKVNSVNGTIGVVADPELWKPFGLIAPIYWLYTGKRDRQLN
ncbi:MAG: SAV_2336 N-terminal domain-related protein [Pseudanabaena sp. ELA645]|jgi:flagellar biosynthesis GTPase FlhF